MPLREFVCKYCEHSVVVNPRLPADYEPNVCCECYERHVAPLNRAAALQIAVAGAALLALLGVR